MTDCPQRVLFKEKSFKLLYPMEQNGHWQTQLFTFRNKRQVKGHKGKCNGITLEGSTKAQRGSRHSSTLSLTSALDGVGGQRHIPAVLRPGKTWYPVYRRLVGPEGRPGRVRRISPPPSCRDSIPWQSST